MEAVANHFRPEFVNRIDDVVVFHSLDSTEIQGIARIQLGNLMARLREQDIAINFDEESMSKLAEAGFDPVYGARPLKRAIQRWVENPLAQKILSGEFLPGDEVNVSVQGNKLVFTK